MSKTAIVNQCLAATLLLAPGLGYCENYLFPTDIVPQGKFDVLAEVGHTDYQQRFESSILNSPTFRAETQHESTRESVGLRYGLTPNTHIGVLASHGEYKATLKSLPDSAFQANDTAHKSSSGNLDLFIKHRFYSEGETPFSLSAGANLEANTANNHYTALELNLITGWKFNESLRAYAAAQTFLSDKDAISDRQTLDIGLYKQITPRITLVPRYVYSHFQQAKNGNILIASTRDSQYLGVSAMIEVIPNTYLIPVIGYFNNGDYYNGFGGKTSDSFNEKSYSIALYHLF